MMKKLKSFTKIYFYFYLLNNVNLTLKIRNLKLQIVTKDASDRNSNTGFYNFHIGVGELTQIYPAVRVELSLFVLIFANRLLLR